MKDSLHNYRLVELNRSRRLEQIEVERITFDIQLSGTSTWSHSIFVPDLH